MFKTNHSNKEKMDFVSFAALMKLAHTDIGIDPKTCSMEEAQAYIDNKSIDFEKKRLFVYGLNESNPEFIKPLVVTLLEKKREEWMIENEEHVKSELSKIVLPFQPFVKAEYFPFADRLDFIFDEEAYLAAAAAKTVPTFETEEAALAYLSSRKKTRCCGCEVYKNPRLFD
jgi:hypothetical protein